MSDFPTNPFPHPPPPSRPKPIACPFKVGDRIHELRFDTIRREWVLDETRPDATITAFSAAGFDYAYDYEIPHGRMEWGMMITGGTCYPEGYRYYRQVYT